MLALSWDPSSGDLVNLEIVSIVKYWKIGGTEQEKGKGGGKKNEKGDTY